MKSLLAIAITMMISPWALAVETAPAKETPAAPAKAEATPEKKKEAKEPRKPSQAELEALKIMKGAEIEISHYDDDTNTFEVTIIKEPGVGPNVTTPEELYRATEMNVDFATFSSKKRDYIGSEFQLKEDLILIGPEQIMKRSRK
ncbi:hypothetical protein AZI85_17140 [Bdellovibrio bacteriovorus]|uniref:Uncharacterized protein n=1 Tax=Bdellovibrio bacteriovorus TaxID=959 RepID=A0A150WT47_BDEBC|nr:hypothetical protein [Bdellovibrio bacteriovorus]KYG67605.1 hypothetical protein AZI85_17140 [Bdellovibrio bacteriovorus]